MNSWEAVFGPFHKEHAVRAWLETHETPPRGIHIHTPSDHNHSVPMLETPPHPEFAEPGANPTLLKIELIRAALQRAHGPMSRNQIKAQMSAWSHGLSGPTLNAALAFLVSEGVVVEGSKGFQWATPADGRILDAIRRKRS